MKSFLSLVVLIGFTAGSMAQALEMTGNFRGSHVNRDRNIKSKSECLIQGGRLTKRGCVLSRTASDVQIIRNENDDHDYTVRIITINSMGKNCSYVGRADMLNQVQLIAREGACEITIGFQDAKTLAVMTNNSELCMDVLEAKGLCQNGGTIEQDQIIRQK